MNKKLNKIFNEINITEKLYRQLENYLYDFKNSLIDIMLEHNLLFDVKFDYKNIETYESDWMVFDDHIRLKVENGVDEYYVNWEFQKNGEVTYHEIDGYTFIISKSKNKKVNILVVLTDLKTNTLKKI